MANIFTVTEINSYIGNKLQYDPGLNNISVRGEVSNCSYSSSGHIYFSVKDSNSQLSCALFKNRLSGLKFKLKDGLSVVVTGSINVYIPGGRYSFIAEKIEMEGVGALYEKYEKLKAKLAEEGLFAPEHKKPLPKYVRTVGVVTSQTGAVLHDIMNITSRRNPYVNIRLAPAAVQGTGAARTLISALKRLEATKPDVIIIGRGGGSFEDLFEFNDEELARAIYDCSIPVISAVGHEVDFTICDFVSDLRAPTPSAAAELAVYSLDDLHGSLIDYHSTLYSLMQGRIDQYRNRVKIKALSLEKMSPSGKLKVRKQQLKQISASLDNNFKRLFDRKKHLLKLYAERLEGFSPLKKIRSGYAYVTDDEERNIKSIRGVSKGDPLNIRVTDGMIRSVVENIEPLNEGE
ncbi:MAG: exodeoxyribonuclease VII large subunit [Lachnospiraceae bacterium]|nr:exodeoxyribonuclease VII large subunit [Lachnospiraceae bacterium]